MTASVLVNSRARVTLNRPEARNALSGEILGTLMPDIVDRLEKDDQIRSAVLTGAGGNFCSGGDVQQIGDAFCYRALVTGGEAPTDNGR